MFPVSLPDLVKKNLHFDDVIRKRPYSYNAGLSPAVAQKRS